MCQLISYTPPPGKGSVGPPGFTSPTIERNRTSVIVRGAKNQRPSGEVTGGSPGRQVAGLAAFWSCGGSLTAAGSFPAPRIICTASQSCHWVLKSNNCDSGEGA